MFGFIILLLVLSFVGRLFFRPFYGYYRPWGDPFGGFGGWGMMSDILVFRFIMRLIPIILVISLISWALR